MNRREMLTALLALAAANDPPLVLAQASSSQRWRVGLLHSARKTQDGKCPRPMFDVPGNLKNFGLVEGQHFVVIGHCDDGQPERLPELARKLVMEKVDVIVPFGPEAIAAAREATDQIPIVMIIGPDPVARGWARSFARPGGNLTGSTWEIDETDSLLLKGYELIREAIPSVKRIVHLEGANHTRLLVSVYNCGFRKL